MSNIGAMGYRNSNYVRHKRVGRLSSVIVRWQRDGDLKHIASTASVETSRSQAWFCGELPAVIVVLVLVRGNEIETLRRYPISFGDHDITDVADQQRQCLHPNTGQILNS